MKKLIYVLIAVFALTSCREDPDLGDLSSDFLVFTNYDGKADFNRFTRYYMPDSVMVIGDTKDPEYWTGSKAADILKAYEDNMQACGYVRTDDKSEAESVCRSATCRASPISWITAILIGGTNIPVIGFPATGAIGDTGITLIRSCTVTASVRC